MKKILAIAWKDTLVRFASPWEWLFFLILPVVFTLVLAGGTGGPSDNRIRLVVVDQAGSPLSAQLISELDKSTALRPEQMALAEAEQQFGERQVAFYLVIPAGFDLARLQAGDVSLELRQQPNNLNALAVSQVVQAAARRVSSQVSIARLSVEAAEQVRPFASAAERQAYFDAALLAAQAELDEAPTRLEVSRGATQDTVDYDPRANSSAGQLITWVFVPLLGISGMLAFERTGGTLRRLLITPTEKATYFLGTIVGQVLMALVQMALLVGFGALVMKVSWGRDPIALAVMLVATAVAGAALGTALGAFVKTENQAGGLSVMLGMVLALLGGCWYPLEMFPAFVRTATLALPTRWAMQGLLDIVLRGQGLAAVLPTAGVLLAFAAVFFGVGVLRFRYE